MNDTYNLRYHLAKKAFKYIADYDLAINKYYNKIDFKLSSISDKSNQNNNNLKLKYGCNPNQEGYISLDVKSSNLTSTSPIKVLNGKPSYINYMDALHSLQLTKEIEIVCNRISATSFKHTVPAGVSVDNDLSDSEKIFYRHLYQSIFMNRNINKNIDINKLNPASIAYLKARNSDPLSSFGDFICINDTVDEETARIIKPMVSDGIIAKSFTANALGILSKKKKGSYIIMEMNNQFDFTNALSSKDLEMRQIFGINLNQERNNFLCNDDVFIYNNIKTKNKLLSDVTIEDMKIAYTTLKYTHSNSIAICENGHVLGIGAGQQNRVDCVKIAERKTNNYIHKLEDYSQSILRRIDPKTKTVHKINYIQEVVDNSANRNINASRNELNNLTLASDGFFPFEDNIEICRRNGIKNIIQPGGSTRDNLIIDKCNQYGMTMVFTNNRIFYH